VNSNFIKLIFICLTVFLVVLSTLQNFAINYTPVQLEGMEMALVYKTCVNSSATVAGLYAIPPTNMQLSTIAMLTNKKGAIQNSVSEYYNKLQIQNGEQKEAIPESIKKAEADIEYIDRQIVELRKPSSIFHELIDDFTVQIYPSVIPRAPGNIRQDLEVRGALTEGNTEADILGRQIQALDAAARAMEDAVGRLNLPSLDGNAGNYPPLLTADGGKVIITPRNVTTEVDNFNKKTKSLLETKNTVRNNKRVGDLLAQGNKDLLQIKIHGVVAGREGVRLVSLSEVREDVEKRAFADIHLALAVNMDYSDGINFANERTATRLAINIARASQVLMDALAKPASNANNINTVNSLKNLEVFTTLMMSRNTNDLITQDNIEKYNDFAKEFNTEANAAALEEQFTTRTKKGLGRFFGFFASVAAESAGAVLDETTARIMQSIGVIVSALTDYIKTERVNTAILFGVIYFVVGQVATIMGAAFRGNTNADPLKAIKDLGEGTLARFLPPAKTEAEQRIDLERLRLEVERERLTLERELRISNGPLGIANGPQTVPLGIANGPQTVPLGIANGPQTVPLGIANAPQTVPLGIANAPAEAPIILGPPAGGKRATIKRGKRHSKRNAKGAPRKTMFARNKATHKKRGGKK
jgi:hypothetical protein